MNTVNRREREVGSYPENSIVGDSKDTDTICGVISTPEREFF